MCSFVSTFLLSMMFSNFIHIAACLSTSFLLWFSKHPIVWIYHILFLPVPCDGHISTLDYCEYCCHEHLCTRFCVLISHRYIHSCVIAGLLFSTVRTRHTTLLFACFLKKLSYFYLYVCVSICTHMFRYPRRPKRGSDALKVELTDGNGFWRLNSGPLQE